MARRFINQLGEHENVDQIYQVTDKQLRTNRNGNLYLQVRLADRTGSVTAMLWNAGDQVYASFDTWRIRASPGNDAVLQRRSADDCPAHRPHRPTHCG